MDDTLGIACLSRAKRFRFQQDRTVSLVTQTNQRPQAGNAAAYDYRINIKLHGEVQRR
jgi:hypothetical protein